MRAGTVSDLDRGVMAVPKSELDLETTLSVGQTFAWHRLNGDHLHTGSGDWFYTTEGEDVLMLRQDGDELHWRATGGMEDQIEDRFRLHESLERFRTEIRGQDELLDEALERYEGLRILNDDFFPCLVSYLLSVQMRIPRIKELYDTLAREYGGTIHVDGHELLRFPRVEELAAATEEELRDLGVGYRARYIDRTTDQLMEGVLDPVELRQLPYREAHDLITELYGVGDKVGDCVLLFSCDQLEAFPVDTWIRQAINEHYPEKHSDDYHAIGDAFRDYFGEHVGYAQEYLFHHIRTMDGD